MYGDLNLNGHSIKNVANPDEESHSVNKEFLESNFIGFKNNIQLNTKLAVVGNDRIALSGPIQVQGRNFICVSFIRPLSQETSISNKNICITFGDSLYLRGISDPTLPLDGVNKQYVDKRFTMYFQMTSIYMEHIKL